MKSLRKMNPSGYITPEVTAIELKAEGVLCESSNNYTSSLPTWGEDEDVQGW